MQPKFLPIQYTSKLTLHISPSQERYGVYIVNLTAGEGYASITAV